MDTFGAWSSVATRVTARSTRNLVAKLFIAILKNYRFQGEEERGAGRMRVVELYHTVLPIVISVLVTILYLVSARLRRDDISDVMAAMLPTNNKEFRGGGPY
jgi:hypothetical protein